MPKRTDTPDHAPRSDRLIVLSIPFQKILRSHLSDTVRKVLAEKADVIVVSPFATIPEFRKRYADPRIGHLQGRELGKQSRLARLLSSAGHFLRIRSHWSKNRDKLQYYWHNRYVRIALEKDHNLKFPYRIVADLLLHLGKYYDIWKLVDNFFGRTRFDHPELNEVSKQYEEVVLIQAASWGFQDQALGWMVRRYGWRSIMLPYTTDQLMVNGHLFCDYDYVCAQGEAEVTYARTLHGIPPERIVKLGSPSFDSIRRMTGGGIERSSPEGGDIAVMFAGTASQYSPRELEILAVKELHELADEETERRIEIVYRPVISPEESQDVITALFRESDSLEIQFPSATTIGVTDFSTEKPEDAMKKLLGDLARIDILVTATMTSLTLDAALLGIPTIVYCPIDHPMLARRRTDLWFEPYPILHGWEKVPTAYTLEELKKLIWTVAGDAPMRDEIVRSVLEAWDFSEVDFEKTLSAVVHAKGGFAGEVRRREEASARPSAILRRSGARAP